MKKLLLIPLLAISLGACAQFQALENNLNTAWQVISTASASPTQIIVAANAFDALETTATQYLNYCAATKYIAQPCARGNRTAVIKAVRAGQAARNALEPFIVANTAGPASLYNALVSAIQSLQATAMPTGN